MMTITVGKADAECPEKVTLTSGMVNAVQIVFSFSEHWDEFKKIAVFSNGATTLDVPLDEESKCFVPHEVLEVAGKEVSVGVYGSKGEGSDYVAIPTEKCSLGKVVEGVNPTGDETADPTPTVLDDLILRVENLEKNGGGGGGGNVPTKLSDLEADSISRSDQEPFDFSAYIANFAGHEAEFAFDNLTFKNMGYGSGVDFDGNVIHGVGAPEADTDGANKKYVDDAVNGIPSWAKQPTKPTYTAEEVGAVAKNQGSANVGKILVVGSDGNLMLADMPTGISDVTGVLDEDFNILLSGDLADGTYTLRYKNTDGSYSDAVTLVVGEIPDPEPEEPQATNWIPNSINADGTPFVGANGEKGYKTNTRMSIGSGNESTSNATGLEVTGFIPIKTGDTIYLKGITIDASSTTQTMVWYNSSFQLSKTASSTETSGVYTGTVFGNVVGEEKSLVINASAVNNVNFNADVAYIRITAGEINADSVINIMRDGQWT